MSGNSSSQVHILLIRHCQSAHQAPGAPFAAPGAAAAAVLASRLSDLPADALYSSPYARAVATVQPFADLSGLPIVTDDRQRERLLAAGPLDDWRIMSAGPTTIPTIAPGRESLADVCLRGLAALGEIAARHAFALVVSHGRWISAILSHIDRGNAFAEWQALRNPDLFLVRWHRDRGPVGCERLAS